MRNRSRMLNPTYTERLEAIARIKREGSTVPTTDVKFRVWREEQKRLDRRSAK